MLNFNELWLCLNCVRTQYKLLRFNNPKDIKQKLEYELLINKIEKEMGLDDGKARSKVCIADKP